MGGKWSVSVIYHEEAITRSFLTGSACPFFAQDPRLVQLRIYGEIRRSNLSWPYIVVNLPSLSDSGDDFSSCASAAPSLMN